MPIVKANQAMPERPVIIVVYGMPGCGKTSLCNTAEKPLLIDCDRGADRAIHRQDSLICNNWEDITSEIDSFRDYKTIIIDTAKAALDDFLMDYVKRKDDVCRRNTQKAYGAMKDEFAAFISKVQSFGVDIIIIAHAKDDKDGDATKFYPDVTGGSKDLILRKADQVGFLSIVNKERKIRWEPDDRIIGKNVAKLPLTKIPNETEAEFAGCMAGIISKTKKEIQARTNSQAQNLGEIEAIKEAISKVSTTEDADNAKKMMLSLPKIQQKQLWAALLERCKSVGISYNKDSKAFILITAE